jgi:glucose/arabinose dehydrogenase
MKMIRILFGLSAFMLLLLLGGACATTTQSAAKSSQTSGLPDPAASQSQKPVEHGDDHAKEDAIPRVKAADAVRMVKAGEAILVDVRDAGSYETMHAKGALHVSYQDIQEGKFGKLPKDKNLIFYCT